MVKRSELRQDINWREVGDFDASRLLPHLYIVGDPEEEQITAKFGDRDYLDDNRKIVGAAKKVIRELRRKADDLEREILWVTGDERYMTYWEDKRSGKL